MNPRKTMDHSTEHKKNYYLVLNDEYMEVLDRCDTLEKAKSKAELLSETNENVVIAKLIYKVNVIKNVEFEELK